MMRQRKSSASRIPNEAHDAHVAKLLAILLACVVSLASATVLHSDGTVDTALLVSVDVSNSVDEHRYRLRMEGIVAALEDSAVMDAYSMVRIAPFSSRWSPMSEMSPPHPRGSGFALAPSTGAAFDRSLDA